MTKFLEYLKRNPIVTAVIAVAVSVAAILSIPQDSYWTRCVLRILMCGAMLFLLWLISGEKTLSRGNNQTAYVIKNGCGLWVLAVISGLIGLLPRLLAHEAPPAGWLPRLVTLFFMFLFACLFEELCFRAILNDAIVYRFRNAKHVFAWSAVVSSLVFGAVHCLGSSLTTAMEWAQAGMKTLECAIVGFAFLILYWKTRNVWACGILHAGFDFLNGLSLAFESNANIGAGSYVSTNESGAANLIYLAAVNLINALIVWRIWRRVGKTVDFEEMRRTW